MRSKINAFGFSLIFIGLMLGFTIVFTGLTVPIKGKPMPYEQKPNEIAWNNKEALYNNFTTIVSTETFIITLDPIDTPTDLHIELRGKLRSGSNRTYEKKVETLEIGPNKIHCTFNFLTLLLQPAEHFYYYVYLTPVGKAWTSECWGQEYPVTVQGLNEAAGWMREFACLQIGLMGGLFWTITFKKTTIVEIDIDEIKERPLNFIWKSIRKLAFLAGFVLTMTIFYETAGMPLDSLITLLFNFIIICFLIGLISIANSKFQSKKKT